MAVDRPQRRGANALLRACASRRGTPRLGGLWTAVALAVGSVAGLTGTPLPAAGTPLDPPPPAIVSVAPAEGRAGTTVEIVGSGFDRSTFVRFGPVDVACYSIESPTRISAVVPVGQGRVDVTAYSAAFGSLQAGPEARFSYGRDSGRPSLKVEALVHPSGPASGGSLLRITGRGFCVHPQLAVKIGGRPAGDFRVESDTSVLAVAPPHPAGTVGVVVAAPSAGEVEAGTFRYSGQQRIAPAPPRETAAEHALRGRG